jgi:hypothetical protein
MPAVTLIEAPVVEPTIVPEPAIDQLCVALLQTVLEIEDV